MASTYSTNLKIELIGTGEQAGTWGTTTNTNLGTALEQAVVGKADVTMSSTTITLTLTNANTAQDARAIYLNLTGSPGGAAVLEVPAIQKPYIVKNGSDQQVTIKVSGQTGVAIPTGKTALVYNNGTDVVTAVDFIPEIATTTVDTTNIEVTNIKAKDGTSAGSIADSTGVVTLASSVLTTTDINGGTIDGAVIGGASAAAGSFTTLNTSGAVVFNDAGADVDFRVEGDTDANLLFVDASNDQGGIGTSAPVSALNVIASVDKVAVIGAASNLDSDADVLWGAGIKETQLLNGTASRPGVLSIGGSLTANESMGIINFFRSGNTDGYRSRAFIRGGTTGSGTANQHGGILMFATAADDAGNPTERMRIDSSGRVGIGTSSPDTATLLTVDGAMTILGINTGHGASRLKLGQDTTAISQIRFYGADNSTPGILQFTGSSADGSVGTERMRIDSSGSLLVGTTTTYDSSQFTLETTASGGANSNGFGIRYIRSDTGGAPLLIDRINADGTLIAFIQAGVVEGYISVTGTTVSYNGGHLSRWAQMLTKPDLLKGTVMSNLDEMNVYVKPTLYWTEEDELPVDEEGNPTVVVGDLKQETSVSDNEQLNKVKVSDVEGDPNVAGVFVNWTYDEAHQVDEINMAMTGDMIIRIAEGVTVARGDLLMSAGNGTAKPQGDDIVRSKTIAKVTSTHVTCTYDDGSYCVPCVLMAC
jgi:hypothetical protein